MPKPKKFIGAEHKKEKDLSKSVEILDTNRTLFVTGLGPEAGKDLTAHECSKMSEVFDTFKPEVEIPIKAEDGTPSTARISFPDIEGFLPRNVIKQSDVLNSIKMELVLLQDLLRQLQTNHNVRGKFDSPDERELLIRGIQAAKRAIGAKER